MLASGLVLLLAACNEEPVPAEHRVPGADAEVGRSIIARIGCGACHEIPGVPGAYGRVGPSLDHVGSRAVIGGIVPNRPGYLIQWVREAPALAPDTAMPTLPIDETEARHVAAYLYTLR